MLAHAIVLFELQLAVAGSEEPGFNRVLGSRGKAVVETVRVRRRTGRRAVVVDVDRVGSIVADGELIALGVETAVDRLPLERGALYEGTCRVAALIDV